ncbi:MAG: twin-arginine translocase TatA/TatE family subunit [Acidimicrobiales bacterium]
MPTSLGPAEILVILVVALIFLGPKRLPEAGRQVGKALAEVRRWSQDMKYEMNQAFNEPPAPTVPASPLAPVTGDAEPPPTVLDVTGTATPEPEPAAAAEPAAAPERAEPEPTTPASAAAPDSAPAADTASPLDDAGPPVPSSTEAEPEARA